MEEIEAPIEQVQEELHHHAEESKEQWIMAVALSAAILAALAAIAALMAGHHSNEAMVDQILAADHWAYYQAKGIKASVLESKLDLLSEMGKQTNPQDREKLNQYKKEQEEIRKSAEEKENSSRNHLHYHVMLARSVTLFQIAIAVAAVSALTRKKTFWFVSLGFGAVAAAFLVLGTV